MVTIDLKGNQYLLVDIVFRPRATDNLKPLAPADGFYTLTFQLGQKIFLISYFRYAVPC